MTGQYGQNTNSQNQNELREPLIEADLTYDIIGRLIHVRKEYGLGQKEIVYQNALAEELDYQKIKYTREKSLPVKSSRTNKTLGTYKPDFIVEDKIIVELEIFLGSFTQEHIKRIYDYLKNSQYEIGLLVNFGRKLMQYKRVILTNDRKNQKLS